MLLLLLALLDDNLKIDGTVLEDSLFSIVVRLMDLFRFSIFDTKSTMRLLTFWSAISLYVLPQCLQM